MARNCKMCDEHNLTRFLLDAGSKAHRAKLEIPAVAGAETSCNHLAPQLVTGQILADSQGKMSKKVRYA